MHFWASILVSGCCAGCLLFAGEEGDDEIENLDPMWEVVCEGREPRRPLFWDTSWGGVAESRGNTPFYAPRWCRNMAKS